MWREFQESNFYGEFWNVNQKDNEVKEDKIKDGVWLSLDWQKIEKRTCGELVLAAGKPLHRGNRGMNK